MELTSPAQIYVQVIDEIDRILGALQVASSNQDVVHAQSTLNNFLGGVQKELTECLDRLREHGEWDIFTIAFYGETNAGKSTLIETLRILLGEPVKMARRRAFKAIQEEYALSPEVLEACREEIEQSSKAINEAAAQATAKLKELDRQGRELLSELHHRQALVVELKRKAPFWKKWLFRLRKPVEEVAQDEAQRQCQAFDAKKSARIADITRINHEAVARMGRAVSLQARQEGAMAQLAPHADGEIIGDGRSDFTRDTASYFFDAGGQKFALLDVPGIEGDEGKVSDQIWNAVRKSHAVFYITAKAATPQKGDPGKPGTLEKIKAHLDDQTEVWAIFNKRVTNPMQLSRPSLVSEDEEASLGVLDNQMRAQLGENYKAHISLSAQPAFLSKADCLVPGSSDEKNRRKFLEKMSTEQILVKTGLDSFRNLLTGEFVKDYKCKIRRANFNKAGKLISGTVDQLSAMQHEKLKPLQIKLQKDAEFARDQLTIKLESLKNELDSLVQQEVDRFTKDVRRNTYACIDRNLDNDRFKQAFSDEITAAQAVMAATFPARLSGAVSNFETEIQEVVERFQKFAEEFLVLNEKINIHGLKEPIALKIRIDNGIKLRGLISALLAAAALISNPGGWIAGTITAVGLVFTLGKAVWGFFDDDYKKAQQRNAIGANLQKVASSIRESLLKSVHESFKLVAAQMQEINNVLTGPAEQLEVIGKALRTSTAELALLSKEISNTGTNV